MHQPRRAVALASALTALNVNSSSSINFCFNGRGTSTLFSLKNSFLNFSTFRQQNGKIKNIGFTKAITHTFPDWQFSLKINVNRQKLPRTQNGLTNIISSVGSDSFLILFDSPIFLIWSRVYLKAVSGTQKSH